LKCETVEPIKRGSQESHLTGMGKRGQMEAGDRSTPAYVSGLLYFFTKAAKAPVF